jgi:predicted ATP-grasp superfamily ATP-dependent carboligase
MRGTLVLAGLSVRLMAESARRAGYAVVALDAFGDRDTRRAAVAWQDIAAPQGLRLDAGRVLEALRAVRGQQPGVLGWVAGTGFEALPQVLQQGAAELPLLGTPAAQVQAVRTPAAFFAALDDLGLPHPPTQLPPPHAADGWLHKDFGSSGGWHVRRAAALPGAAAPGGPQGYFQAWAPGESMSVLFVANGRAAQVLGHQQQIVAALGGRPCVWQGVIGPLQPPAAVQARLEHALAALVPRFGLRGLCSLDYLLHGSGISLLEVNARPPASLAVHEGPDRPPLMQVHLQACLQGSLPDGVGQRPAALHGTRIAYARRACRVDAPALALLEAAGWCHDLPAAPQAFHHGDPVCTVSAGPAGSMAEVQQQLADRVREARALLTTTETVP